MLRALSMHKLLIAGALGLVATVLLAYILVLFSRIAYLRANRRPDLRCPHCGGSDVRPSYPAGFPDGLFARFECFPFRCRACSCRFFRARA